MPLFSVRLPWAGKPRHYRLRLFLLLGLLTTALSLLVWRSNAFWDALSPVTNKQALYRLAGRTKVDPLLLASIIRAESSFNPFAESHRGAVGLMQVMPATAQQLAHELKLNYQDADDLYVQDINLTMGAVYFSRQLKAFQGNLVLALAAYNAGPAKVKAWHLDTYGREQDDLIAAVPLPSTRAYVRRVLLYYEVFKKMQAIKRFLNGDPQL